METDKLKSWKVGKNAWDGTEYWTVEDASGKVVCMEPVEFYAYPEGPFIEPDGQLVDAWLIAAAPETARQRDECLAVCKALVEHYREVYGPDASDFEIYQEASTAIANAKSTP